MRSDPAALTAELDRLWRVSAPQVIGALARRAGDLDSAEDAAQEALLAAAAQWPYDGVPTDPTGWLITVGARRLADRWRSERSRAAREQRSARVEPVDPPVSERDDSLTLLLLCCHPVLPTASQVALTLRVVAGLSTAQIARAFLVPESTMAQRISRAKARLREVDAPFSGPPVDELGERVAAAAHVLYLVFTEGHTSTAGAALHDVSLAEEAIRLTRRLHEQLPGVGEISGLLALMLLTHARRSARTDAAGALVPLADQDRTRWDAAQIGEGIELVESALPVGRVGPYQLQAAIAAVHAEAATAGQTDWPQIRALYDMLDGLAPSPVVTINRAVAVAMVDGPGAGLALLEPLSADRQAARNHRLHSVRAHLLQLAGRDAEAAEEFAAAARLTTSIPEQRYLNARATGEPTVTAARQADRTGPGPRRRGPGPAGGGAPVSR